MVKIGAPSLYTIGQQRVAKALLEAYRTGNPVKGLKPLDKTRLLNAKIVEVNKNAQIILKVDEFLHRIYVVSDRIYGLLISVEYRQKLSAAKHFMTLEQYQNRESVPLSDARKNAKKAPYKGMNKVILSSEPDIAVPILFTEPPKSIPQMHIDGVDKN